MPSNPHYNQRDSLSGFNRKRLRGTLRVAMGIKPNSDMFPSWDTNSASEQRREERERRVLEQHLREAKPTEQQFIKHIRSRLADAGPPEPVRYDKQALAEQKRKRPPARKAGKGEGSFISLSQRVRRLAQLERELMAEERVPAVTADKRKDYGHFVMEKE